MSPFSIEYEVRDAIKTRLFNLDMDDNDSAVNERVDTIVRKLVDMAFEGE